MDGRQSFIYSKNNAEGHANQHNGNVYGPVTYNYGSGPSPQAPQARMAGNEPQTMPTELAAGARPRSLDDFRIAIMCALQKEFDAVDALLEEIWEDEEAFVPRQSDSNSYTFGRLGGKPVALVNLPSMGKVNAAAVAAHLKTTLPYLEIAFLVGICGGAPHDDKGTKISYGDVIIGRQVIQEDFGRFQGGRLQRKTDVEDVLGRLAPRIKQWLLKLSGMRAEEQLVKDIMSTLDRTFQKPKLVRRFAFPGRLEGQCFPAEREEVQIFFGRVATADAVVKDAAYRDELIKRDRVIGFEMESAGLWDQIDTVLVKSVCDYANEEKSKEWQDFAALTAAACAQAMIKKWELRRRG